jgi:hypothetical protein
MPVPRLELGKFQTRNSRIVEITDSRWIDEKQLDGTIKKTRIWNGTLYKADGKTFDATYEWEDSGRRRNSQGVASQFDIDLRNPIELRGSGEAEPADPRNAEIARLKEENARLIEQVNQLASDNRDLKAAMLRAQTPDFPIPAEV